ncbi:MAG: hypothetical protein K2X27_11130, partial [Candidatus Obscuribacterales bacterium]|nr:hypothetical protein [Candidatus Obscuribacterales bacterium]
MPPGDGQSDIHPPPVRKELGEVPGAGQTKATSEKLLFEATDAKRLSLTGASGVLPMTASSFGMVSLTKSDKLTPAAHLEHKAIKTGSDTADFALNFVDGGLRNLANIGNQTIRSIKDPLSTLTDVKTAGQTIYENPTVVKNMATDFTSTLAGSKGAGEAGAGWGNLTTTVGLFFVGGKNAVQKAETRAAESVSAMEQKVAQTSRILNSAEAGTIKSSETLAARLGTGTPSNLGSVSTRLESRVDGLATRFKVGEPVIKAPKIEPVIKAPEPLVKAPKIEPVIKAPEPVIKAPEPVVKAPEPVVKAPEPVVKAPEPVVKAPEPVVKAPEPVV